MDWFVVLVGFELTWGGGLFEFVLVFVPGLFVVVVGLFVVVGFVGYFNKLEFVCSGFSLGLFIVDVDGLVG